MLLQASLFNPSPLFHPSPTPDHLRQSHAHAIKTGALTNSPSTASKLLSLYCNPALGSPDLARSVFDQIPDPPPFCWNAIIKCYVDARRFDAALSLFLDSLCRSESVPDNFLLPCVVKACGELGAEEEGKQAHGLAFKVGLGSDCYVQGSFVSFYSKCGVIGTARKVFDGMSDRDPVAWNSIIDGYVKCGDIRSAQELFDGMPQRDSFSWTSLINGYSKCGMTEVARGIFNRMPDKNVVSWNTMIDGYMRQGEHGNAKALFAEMPDRSIVSWNTMITGYEKNGKFKEALEVFEAMLEAGVVPNSISLVGALSAASGLALLGKGRWIHRYVLDNGFQLDGVLATCLIDMYAKCGSIDDALKFFWDIPRKRLGHWTAIIVGLGMHGRVKNALRMFKEMLRIGLNPHPITFIGVLNACSHAGMVDEGRQYFSLMSEKYGIQPMLEHYGCLIDLLCRVGCLEEARDIIEKMPVKPNGVIWMSLLSGCRKHGNVEIGQYAAERVLELTPTATGSYVLLSNIYAATKKWDKVSQLREMMKDRGIRKEPAYSMIEHEGLVHRFIVGDRSHIQTEMIYSKLKEMEEKLKHAGHVPDTSQVLLCIEESEKEAELVHHSERLAIAFGLINLKKCAPIRIMKNLRVCNDCHNVSKHLSRIYNCEIIVRDNSRFHHFRNGLCSCNDYW